MLIYCKHGRIGKNQVDVLEAIQIEEENKITSEFCENVSSKETETERNKNERETYDGKLFQKEKAKEEQKLKQIKPTLSTSKDICTIFIKSNLQSSANQELKFNQSTEHKEDDNFVCQTDNQLLFFHGTTTTTIINKAVSRPYKFMNERRISTEIYPITQVKQIQFVKTLKNELFLPSLPPIDEENDSAVPIQENKLDIPLIGFENLYPESEFLPALGKQITNHKYASYKLFKSLLPKVTLKV